MKKICLIIACLFLFTGVFGIITNPVTAAEGKPVLLKVPICFATSLPGLGSTIKWVADRIPVASNGMVKMKVYEPNKLVAPLDTVSPATGRAKFRPPRFLQPFPSGRKPANFWHGSTMVTA